MILKYDSMLGCGMMDQPFKPWTRDGAGYVWLTPLVAHAAGVTEEGEIALSLGEYIATAMGSVERRSQFVCSPHEAMEFARSILRAAAMADGQIEVLKGPEAPNKTWVKARVLAT
jgi:hypothetical protein